MIQLFFALLFVYCILCTGVSVGFTRNESRINWVENLITHHMKILSHYFHSNFYSYTLDGWGPGWAFLCRWVIIVGDIGWEGRVLVAAGLVWISWPRSRSAVQKLKTFMFGPFHSFIQLVNYSFVNLLNTRFLYIPRLGCMVSYF
ncbi:hypothetical protein Hanom_Chr14g01262841 [Helianthus anomalus]